MSTNWDDPAEMLSRAQTARNLGDRDLAYQLYARASELNPQEAIAWQGRADTATSSDEALVSYAYASALNPDDAPLARTLDASIAQRVQGATKTDVPLLVALGQELAEVGLTDRAHTVLERATELDSSSTDALVWLAGVTPDDQEQLNYLDRALATNPRDPRARAGLLSVKLPPPPASAPAPTVTATAAAVSTSSTITSSPTASTPAPVSASDSTERMRQLRASVPPAEKKPAPLPSEMFKTAAPSPNKNLQYVLIGLIVLVFLLVIAGVILLRTQ